VPDVPLDRDAIVTHLRELSDELGKVGPQHVIVVAGGSLLARRDLRAATADVDSMSRLGSEPTVAIAAVGRRRGLSSRWLNDSAATFRPASFREGECEVLLLKPIPSSETRAWPVRSQAYQSELGEAPSVCVDDAPVPHMNPSGHEAVAVGPRSACSEGLVIGA
jgi:hypothetical protein